VSGSPHCILLAAAGTGKTYRLTGHFLDLLFRDVPPERILATTFTRKAAGEILARVLRWLVDAAEKPKVLAELNGLIHGREATVESCEQRLADLTRKLDRFQVRTLDSFFVHLARVFALDLALPPEWNIADERVAGELRDEAIARVLAEADPLERVELLRALQKEAASRSVHDALVDLVDRARAAWLESEAGAWERVQPGPGLSEAELGAVLERLEALETPRTKAGKPDGNWQKALDKARRQAAADEWEALLDGGIGEKVATGQERYAKKDITGETLAVFTDLVRQAGHVLISRLAHQNDATRRFLDRYERVRHELVRERGTLRFEDLPAALAPRHGEDARFFDERDLDLWFRLDGRIDHLLLDEFQDTAPIQWRVLAPLAEEVVADGLGERSFFCVGDVKQSIYGWRQAEPRLLLALPDRLPGMPEPETMAKSYRSASMVLDAVNRVFAGIDGNPMLAQDDRAVLRDAAREWRAGFEQHETAKPQLPGAVELREAIDPADGEDKEAPILLLAADRVAELAREAPAATIGVLLRRKKWLPRLIYLLRDRGIRASGEGGNPLTDSAAVLAFLSLLHLADHPSDTAAAFHVATSPLGEHLDLAADPRDGVPEQPRRRLAREVRTRLGREGYGGLCASIFAANVDGNPAWTGWDHRRFAQLVEVAHAFDEAAGLRPAEFADHVRLTKVEDPAAAQVRVMTIHAAKGLEFDAVVLPELDQDVDRHSSDVLTSRPEPFEPIVSASHSTKRLLYGLNEELGALAAESRGRGFEEALSVLYVAMTRAARRLEMIVPKKSRKACTYAGLLRHALGAGEPDDDGVIWRHPDNAEDWARELDGEGGAGPAPRGEEPGLAPTQELRSLPLRRPSAEEGGGPTSAHEILRPRSRAATTRGSLVHRWLEELEWIEGFDATDEELLAIGEAIEPDLESRRAALRKMRDALASPEVRDALARPAKGAFEVRCERAFSVVLADEHGERQLWNGSIDRLVLERRGGKVIGAEVLDYKTDRVSDNEIDRRAEFYRPQIARYRAVVAEMTGLPVEDVRGSLLFLATSRLVDLDG